MYFTKGKDRAFEQLMQQKPGFDHFDSGGDDGEGCNSCRFHRPHSADSFCSFDECPYEPGRSTKR